MTDYHDHIRITPDRVAVVFEPAAEPGRVVLSLAVADDELGGKWLMTLTAGQIARLAGDLARLMTLDDDQTAALIATVRKDHDD